MKKFQQIKINIKIQQIKTNFKRHFKVPPEHIGYIRIHGEELPEYRCPAEDCGLGVSDDWICCPYCGQKLGKFEEDRNVRFSVIRIRERMCDQDET